MFVVFIFLCQRMASDVDSNSRRTGLPDRDVHRSSRSLASRSTRSSLFGLVLAIGLVVDDAIVVVEAVEHHIEEGMAPRDATIKAMSEVAAPVMAIAVILAAVFVPTALIPGITGRLYQQFALTIAISVIISAFNALSLSPALCALLLKPKAKETGGMGRFYGWFNRGFGKAATAGLRRRLSRLILIHRARNQRSSLLSCFCCGACILISSAALP